MFLKSSYMREVWTKLMVSSLEHLEIVFNSECEQKFSLTEYKKHDTFLKKKITTNPLISDYKTGADPSYRIPGFEGLLDTRVYGKITVLVKKWLPMNERPSDADFQRLEKWLNKRIAVQRINPMQLAIWDDFLNDTSEPGMLVLSRYSVRICIWSHCLQVANINTQFPKDPDRKKVPATKLFRKLEDDDKNVWTQPLCLQRVKLCFECNFLGRFDNFFCFIR